MAEIKTAESHLPPLKKVAAIVGPTGTGKSDLAIRLAKELNGEVISCDSMQVYRKMDIGTAKATKEEMNGIPHHLIDIQEYDEPYNVKIFQQKCREAIEEISSRGKLPILCGGTGLYVKAALYDYVFTEEEKNETLEKELDALSNTQLVSLLQQKDPGSLEKIHPNNRKRLLRAAFIAQSGKIKSQREEEQKHEPLYDIYFAGLNADKSLVDERIEKRVDRMFDAGLVQEVASLFSHPESWEYTSFQGIGYKEFIGWLKQEQDLDQVRQAIVIHTRQYAKRQMTWFRNQMPVHWYDLQNPDAVLKDMKEWLHD